jgi:hypothetical protein
MIIRILIRKPGGLWRLGLRAKMFLKWILKSKMCSCEVLLLLLLLLLLLFGLQIGLYPVAVVRQ